VVTQQEGRLFRVPDDFFKLGDHRVDKAVQRFKLPRCF
jgi:hypothetical protein